MRDPGLEKYVESIERHLGARRAAPQVLSPRDFALARAWYASGVALGAVVRGIDRAFAAGHRAPSLAFCRKLVEAESGPSTPGRTPRS